MKVAILVSSLGQGGAEKVMARLGELLAEKKDFQVDLVVLSQIDPRVRNAIGEQVNLVELQGRHYLSILKPPYESMKAKKFWKVPWQLLVAMKDLWTKSIFPIVKYIKMHRPAFILTAHYNSITIVANWFTGASAKVIITEHTVLSSHFPCQIWFMRKIFPTICRLFYPKATKIVGVSKYVAQDMISYLRLPEHKVISIYNPVVGEGLREKGEGELSLQAQKLFAEKRPVFLAVGRLSYEKDHWTLLHAFALLREKMEATLLILGDGVLLPELQEKAQELELGDSIRWLGFQSNPLPYIREADVLVLSSLYEGLPTVVLEALALGTTVVATACPGGIREILADGEAGYLVPMQSPVEMSCAMLEAYRHPMEKGRLFSQSLIFSEENAVVHYTSLLCGESVQEERRCSDD